ncbi:cytochrome c oxidase assembly factor 8 [Lethenteron reissneri]|uniref:cytochrome c oxidase assembly factor 8 n=1 Tax=Lethenteron reissneri TaxID=7753 RepID=UPI002AB70D5F|nr:cytochrome c oxidase assembly factor 8 [Lethenteron reissneri]
MRRLLLLRLRPGGRGLPALGPLRLPTLGPVGLPTLGLPATRTAASGEHREARSAAQPPAEPERDWVGPPDRDSNLRPVRVGRRPAESPLELQLRELRGDTEAWSHHFWSEQNLTFSREKQKFIVKRLRDKGLGTHDEDGSKRSLSVEEMAEFYKGFLDDNYTKHLNYNKEWYRRNFTMTWMMGRVAVLRAWRFVLSGGRPR